MTVVTCKSTRYGEGCGHPVAHHDGSGTCCCCNWRQNDPGHVEGCDRCRPILAAYVARQTADHASDRTSDRGAVSLHAIRDVAGFTTACLLGALIVLGLLALGADRRCAHDPSLAICEPATTTTQETTRP